MTCDLCGTKIIEKKATLDSPYHYRMSGLSNVYLIGILVRRCIHCGTESPVIPRIAELHKLIAREIVDKPELLCGEEIRYLRKYAGFSAKRFAALLQIDTSHLSRVENGKCRSLGAPTDKLARTLAISAIDQDYTRKILMQVADNRIKARRMALKNRKRPIFKLVSNRWTAAA